MLSDEEFLQALVDGLPEAFPAVHEQLDYYFDDGRVLLYVVLADARRWVEDNVLVIERPGYTDEMHQQMCEALGRAAYYGSIGDVSVGDADLDRLEALDRGLPPPHATVRPGAEGALQRFWAVIEAAAEDADGPRQTLLMIELYEGVGWTEDVVDYLGPRALELMHAARIELAWCNGQIGRWAR